MRNDDVSKNGLPPVRVHPRAGGFEPQPSSLAFAWKLFVALEQARVWRSGNQPLRYKGNWRRCKRDTLALGRRARGSCPSFYVRAVPPLRCAQTIIGVGVAMGAATQRGSMFGQTRASCATGRGVGRVISSPRSVLRARP